MGKLSLCWTWGSLIYSDTAVLLRADVSFGIWNLTWQRVLAYTQRARAETHTPEWFRPASISNGVKCTFSPSFNVTTMLTLSSSELAIVILYLNGHWNLLEDTLQTFPWENAQKFTKEENPALKTALPYHGLGSQTELKKKRELEKADYQHPSVSWLWTQCLQWLPHTPAQTARATLPTMPALLAPCHDGPHPLTMSEKQPFL